MRQSIYKIGLTGGIGSGKSAAAEIFSELGVPLVDADIIARELVEPGQAALTEIIAAFGQEILDSQGSLDRARLRRLIFSDKPHRLRLEAILHPQILREMDCRTARLTAPYCVLVIPLLMETDQKNLVNRILVIDVAEEVQRRRLKTRDGFSDAEINAILGAQSTRAARLAAADDIIENNADLAALHRQVKHYHQKYLDLASRYLPPAVS